ncbi:extensin family protein [Pseudomonas sp. RIT-PI-S]|uniref:extensin-like domain-containing protein n=1 Tax=Pseudomonas sp. RIT-PI-S TaxID=3035295 RepID=UPI0021D99B94|nr:extensin family protein [Pseudomonas sp. RIT-PI-S]
MRGWLSLVAIALMLALGWSAWPIAPRWNPWAPLDVEEAPNWLTRYKLLRLRGDPQVCRAALATSKLQYRPQANSPPGDRCPLLDVVRVTGGPVRLSSGFLASCPLAVAFAMFERHGLQPAAQATFGMPVTGVEHLGSFACRNVYNRSQGRLSQHASANALDIAAIRLADGRRISVVQGWAGGGKEAQFLRQVRDAACQSFSTVLGPDYNAAHRDHFHVDMGGWAVCR